MPDPNSDRTYPPPTGELVCFPHDFNSASVEFRWPAEEGTSLKQTALSLTAFFIMAICWSPLLPGLLSVDSSLAFVTAFALFTALVFAKRGVDIPQSALALLLMACCLLLFLATGSRTDRKSTRLNSSHG